MRQLIPLLVILLLSTTYALDITTKTNTDVIIKDYTSQITLDLNLTNATPGAYNLYTLADVSIQPSQTFQVDSSSFQKSFTISPNDNLNFTGNYAFTYVLNQRGKEKYENRMILKILDLEDIIEIASDIIQPESKQLTLYIQNKENVELHNLKTQFSSVLFETEQTTLNLRPNEKLPVTLEIDPDKLSKTKAGAYIITATFELDNTTKKIQGNLYLKENQGITTLDDKAGFLIQSHTISKINSGNTVEPIKIQIQKNIFSRFFTTFDTAPTLIERSGLTVSFIWIKDKHYPTEILTVKSKTNYLFPILILLLGILSYFAYRRYAETKLEIQKSVQPVKASNDTFALKVKLLVKARKSVQNVSITDKIPTIVKVYKKFGTIKPDKIDAHSRKISWSIGDLQTGEERIIDYIIYSKVGVVGKFSLPQALAIFEKEDNVHEIKSNSVFFMNEQSKE